MTLEVAHRQGWQIFEVVLGVPLMVALALNWFVPLSFPLGRLAPAGVLGGAVLAGVGVILVVLARRQLALSGQPTDPGQPTSQLVTGGVFAYSRNPLYLGGIAILAGGALALDLPWVWVLLVPGFIGCHVILVRPEERYLAARFGVEYRAYAARVRRWLGRT